MSKFMSPLIVGNWKSTPKTLNEAIKFVKQLEKKINSSKLKLPKKAYLLATPEVFITSLNEISKRGYIGAQTLNGIKTGQITGATTSEQLISSGASFTLIGHSEVRSRGETQNERKEKIYSSLSSGLCSILCIGEHTRDKEGKYIEELENDIKETLSLVKREQFSKLMIAYEPVWAIGGQTPATTSECFEAVIAIRRALASIGGIDYAKKVQILYGGTVTEDNAKNFIEEGGVDGLLIGRASQNVLTFTDIIKKLYV